MDKKAFYKKLPRPALIEVLSVLFGLVEHLTHENEVLKIQLKRAKNG